MNIILSLHYYNNNNDLNKPLRRISTNNGTSDDYGIILKKPIQTREGLDARMSIV